MHFARAVSAGLSGFVAFSVTVVGLAVIPATPAYAVQGTLPGNVASSWQTNGVVRGLASSKGRVFLGGDFTSVRPPGNAAGTGEVRRTYLAAFDASTGQLDTSFPDHTLNGAVHAVTTFGDTVYVGGNFTTVDGVVRNRAAAFSASTGALLSWNPNASNRVSALAANASTVYLGGSFTRIGGGVAPRIAAVNTSNGARVAGFSASADSVVYGLALARDESRLYAAGAFEAITGGGQTSDRVAAALDPVTGAVRSFPAASPAAGVIPTRSDSCLSVMKSVTTDADSVYFGAEGTGWGCFDGSFAANVADGSVKWVSRCLGATQGVAVVSGVVYGGSHAHDCSGDAAWDPDAFPELGSGSGTARHLTARSAATGKLVPWYPNTNGGTGAGLGPRVLASDGTQLFLGGEFTTVNGKVQQGFARFSPTTGDLTAPARPARPIAVARAGGKISVFVQPPTDLDDANLLVRLYRDGATTPVATKQVRSLFWRQPILAFEDNGLSLGTRHTYTADAVEDNGANASAKSSASPAVTVTSTPARYQDAVAKDNPALYWRLGEPAAPVAADYSDGLVAGTYSGGMTFGQAGALASDANTAVATDGATGFVSSERVPTPGAFSAEAWFKTTTTNGGKIIGFGDKQRGLAFGGGPALSSNYDKHVYMTNDGRLVFGVHPGYPATVTSGKSYNDGAWHHVVAAQGPDGMVLHVDGARVGRNSVAGSQNFDNGGFWRVGGDNLGGWPNQPASHFFAGAIDDVAVYENALSLAQVQAHFTAGGGTPPTQVVPADAYGKTVYDDSPSLYWRLDERSGSTAGDASNNDTLGDYVGAVTLGQSGVPGSTGAAAAFDGADSHVASSQAGGGPSAYSAELWFKTTTTSGGKLIGYGDAARGLSGSYDKHVYMTNDGRLVFGVWTGAPSIVTSPTSYNDGAWHHVVATQGAGGMALYVDGEAVDTNGESANQGFTGFWRVGGDNLGWWPEQPSSHYFAGTIDEVAVYPTALTAERVSRHFTAASGLGG